MHVIFIAIGMHANVCIASLATLLSLVTQNLLVLLT